MRYFYNKPVSITHDPKIEVGVALRYFYNKPSLLVRVWASVSGLLCVISIISVVMVARS